MTPIWRVGAKNNALGISKTQALKPYARGSESWEQVKDGWETMNKFRECKEILEAVSVPEPYTPDTNDEPEWVVIGIDEYGNERQVCGADSKDDIEKWINDQRTPTYEWKGYKSNFSSTHILRGFVDAKVVENPAKLKITIIPT